jgi:hypothetical protein
VATLAELREALLSSASAVVESTEAQAATQLAWVRIVRSRTPALDVLDAGDVVILPLAALPVVAPTPADSSALAEAIARPPAAAVVIVGELDGGGDASRGAIAAALVAALRGAAVPVYQVPITDAGTLERRIIGFLVNRRAEIERQATELEERLHQLALVGADATALAAAIADAVGRAIALEDEHGASIAVHAPADIPASAVAAAAYLARPRRARATRIPLPGRAGSLVVLGDEPLGEAARQACRRIAPFLALELGREEAVRRARDLERRVESLPSAGPPWVVIVARQGGGDDSDTLDRREEVRARIRRLAPGRRVALRGDARSVELRIIAATAADDATGLGLASSVAGLLGRTVGVSEPFGGGADRPTAEADARAALEAAEGMADPIDVARADRISVYRLLGAVHNAPDGLRHARSLVAAASRRGSPDDARTLATLRAIVDHPSAAEAAAALGVHRNTILYRIRVIEQRTGWDLRDPDLRLALGIAVRLVQSAQI